MEHISSFNKQLRQKITVRAVMIKKNRILETDIDGNKGKKAEITR